MQHIEPDMVLGKSAVDGRGDALGEVVDVGVHAHNRVKYLVLGEKGGRIPIRTVGVDEIDDVSPEMVRLRVKGRP